MTAKTTRFGIKQGILDNETLKVIDMLIYNLNNKYDCCIVVDGYERSGKTTLALNLGYAFAEKTGRSFSNENVFFDVEKMANFASNTRNQIILFDEAVLGFLAADWQNKVQKQLIKLLMTAGKYNHCWIFVIPQFKKLSEYLAMHRANCLFRTIVTRSGQRGHFKFFDRQQKSALYEVEIKKSVHNVFPTFQGYSGLPEKDIIDMKLYEKAKDYAIDNIFGKDKAIPKGIWEKRFYRLLKRLIDNGVLNKTNALKMAGINATKIDWSEIGEKNDELQK